MERPLRYSWILPDRLAVGARPRLYADLLSLGFGAALSLQEEAEPCPSDGAQDGLRLARVSIRDGIIGGVPSHDQIRKAVEILGQFLAEGRRTYVHCYAGVGRSPTICMAYLAREEGLSLGEAYRRVAGAHAPTEPTAGQLVALAQFLESLAAERGS